MDNFILGEGAKFFRGGPKRAEDPVTKIRKGLIQNGCPNRLSYFNILVQLESV